MAQDSSKETLHENIPIYIQTKIMLLPQNSGLVCFDRI